ncbi:MAG: methionyl-tRNA formyltransferase [Eubacteriales bacterium]
MRILFMGTPELARECLRAVYEKKGVEIVAAVTQTDKPKGRGMKLVPPPVKVFAEEHGIPVLQPQTLRDGSFDAVLRELDPEMIVVVAYGKILPPSVLSYPKYGCINAHGSLLPKYRGAAPIQRAILGGETVTGITAMYMDDGVDTGDMILKLECPITDADDYGTLHDKLAVLAGEAMTQVIDRILDGTITREKQPEEGWTYAAKITKEDCVLDFARPPREVFNRIRGLSPAPYAVTHTPDGKLLKLTSAEAPGTEVSDAAPGTVLSTDGGKIRISCGGGVLTVTGVVPEGKKPMSAADYLRGRKLFAGDLLK